VPRLSEPSSPGLDEVVPLTVSAAFASVREHTDMILASSPPPRAPRVQRLSRQIESDVSCPVPPVQIGPLDRPFVLKSVNGVRPKKVQVEVDGVMYELKIPRVPPDGSTPYGMSLVNGFYVYNDDHPSPDLTTAFPIPHVRKWSRPHRVVSRGRHK